MKIEDIPYFAIAAAMLLLSLFIYNLANSQFWPYLFPTYLTEALLLVVLGFAKWKGYKNSGFTAFIMTLVWLFNQILSWSGTLAGGSFVTFQAWIFLGAQVFLAGSFLINKPIKYFNMPSDAWPYAANLIVMLYAISKMWIVISQTLPVAWFLWGLAIGLITVGYMIPASRGKTYRNYGVGIQLVGLMFTVLAAFLVNGPGLALA